MAPRDHEGSDRAMRLILSAGEVIHLAAAGRLVHVEEPAHLSLLIGRVLLIEAPEGAAPRLPVEALRAISPSGDTLRVETVGQRSGEPILVPSSQASVMATLLDGHFSDRWTAEHFGIDLENAGDGPCEAILDLYLPPLEDDGGEAKPLTVETVDNAFDIEVHRGGPTPLHLPLQDRLSVEFRTQPEPYQGADARSRGVLIASIRDSSGQVADVFHLSTYFD